LLVIPANAGIQFDRRSQHSVEIKMDPGFTRAARLPFGPAAQLARFAHLRRDDEQ